MNILYISSLPESKSGGPRYSVPNQIAFQSKYDHVYWVNLNKHGIKNSYIVSHDYEDPKLFKIEDLAPPFNNPDLVIFQEVYNLAYCKISYILRKKNIPYIITPRGSLTQSAQKQKGLKKRLGNILLFNKFIKSASAIQYLTKMEYESSGSNWNDNHHIIPNGTDTRVETKDWKGSGSLKGIFIGRMMMNHKGIDLLIQACIQLRDKLIKEDCNILLYGPDRNGAKEIIEKQIKQNSLEDIIELRPEIHGKEKEQALLESDFFILTSRFEGHPMGLIEALSYGLPCIVTTGSNMAGEVLEANAGWTAETNEQSVVKAFERLLNEKDQFSLKSENARNLSKRYDWDVLARSAKEEYESLIN
ncbi:glycosyltransferase [Pontibacillus salipaludis]|uniref:glycosyltransferase n=1 Tax=Pontibacillus salipaludis TaxID=1697394 RepID=UPI0031F161BA